MLNAGLSTAGFATSSSSWAFTAAATIILFHVIIVGGSVFLTGTFKKSFGHLTFWLRKNDDGAISETSLEASQSCVVGDTVDDEVSDQLVHTIQENLGNIFAIF